MKVLFLDGFTTKGDYKATDAIGYGRTSCDAIRKEFASLGHQIISASEKIEKGGGDIERRRLGYILDCYKLLLELDLSDFDAIFIFHAFQQFPAEVKRILCDLGKELPVIGYAIGSHWIPSGVYRRTHYPGLHIEDLSALYSLDRILIYSLFFKDALMENISKFNAELAKELEKKIEIVPLPLNTELIDSLRDEQGFDKTTIVFNHSLISSKNPKAFFEIMKDILNDFDVNIVVTRRVDKECQGFEVFEELLKKHGDRIMLGGTMPLDEYYRTLWKCDIQVSTAMHETFGVSTVEAMYTNNVCLVPNRVSYPEVVAHQEVLYSSEEELRQKLVHFIEKENDRKRVASELREIAARYSAKNVVPHIIQAIRNAKSLG